MILRGEVLWCQPLLKQLLLLHMLPESLFQWEYSGPPVLCIPYSKTRLIGYFQPHFSLPSAQKLLPKGLIPWFSKGLRWGWEACSSLDFLLKLFRTWVKYLHCFHHWRFLLIYRTFQNYGVALQGHWPALCIVGYKLSTPGAYVAQVLWDDPWLTSHSLLIRLFLEPCLLARGPGAQCYWKIFLCLSVLRQGTYSVPQLCLSPVLVYSSNKVQKILLLTLWVFSKYNC